MKAVVVHGAGDLRIEELPDPIPGVGEVLISMEWGGICGSDLAYWKYGRSGTALLKNPMVLGHEASGRISALGSGVVSLQVGQSVTFQPAQLVGDGVMSERLSGRTNLYPQVRYCGSAQFDPHTDGLFSQLKIMKADQVRVLPDGLDTRRGALAEPLAVALHAVVRAGDVKGKVILVNGCGAIGSLIIAALKYSGASKVLAADVSPHALKVARAMGADEVIDLTNLLVDDEITISFDASGAPAALGNLLHATAKGGTVVQVGNLPSTAIQAVLGDLVTRELSWVGSFRFSAEIDDAIAALASGLDVEPLITHEFELADAEQAMSVAAGGGSSKVLLNLR